MTILVLKLTLTPVLIGIASIAQRRYGPRVGGLLVGLPLTSGPIALFLAMEQGKAFAARSSRGTLLGLIAEAAFCLAYAHVARYRTWLLSTLAAVTVYMGTAVFVQILSDGLVPIYLGVLIVLTGALKLMPQQERAVSSSPAPRWDIPARMLIATAFVLALTAAAGGLGPKISGVASPFPIYAGVLAAFTHAVDGHRAASAVLRGVLTGLFAFATFFLVVGATIQSLGTAATFLSAAGCALLVQALSRFVPRVLTGLPSGTRTR
jgi:uncharacterized membrane protein